MEGDTTLVDIYEAAGGIASEDRTQVSFNPTDMKPFEMIVTAYPSEVKMDGLGNVDMTFQVILTDRIIVNGSLVDFQSFSSEVTIPVEQVRIHKKASEL